MVRIEGAKRVFQPSMTMRPSNKKINYIMKTDKTEYACSMGNTVGPPLYPQTVILTVGIKP